MKKIITILGIIIILVLVGFAIWYFLGQKPAPKYTGPVEKIIIANFGERSVLNLIAKEKGFFKENGLDVQMKEFTAGTTAVTALLAGEVDIAPAADLIRTP